MFLYLGLEHPSAGMVDILHGVSLCVLCTQCVLNVTELYTLTSAMANTSGENPLNYNNNLLKVYSES